MITQYAENMCQRHTRERDMKILEAVADLIILQLRICELRDGPLVARDIRRYRDHAVGECTHHRLDDLPVIFVTCSRILHERR